LLKERSHRIFGSVVTEIADKNVSHFFLRLSVLRTGIEAESNKDGCRPDCVGSAKLPEPEIRLIKDSTRGMVADYLHTVTRLQCGL